MEIVKIMSLWPAKWAVVMINVPSSFCGLCAQNFWCMRTFLEMSDICATIDEEISAF